MLTIGCLCITWWVLKKNAHKMGQSPAKIYIRYRAMNELWKNSRTATLLKNSHERSASEAMDIALTTPPNDNHNVSILTRAKNTLDPVLTILQHKYGFNEFMVHLTKEYSTENGLAIIEFTQYQLLMKQIYSPVMDDISFVFMFDVCSLVYKPII